MTVVNLLSSHQNPQYFEWQSIFTPVLPPDLRQDVQSQITQMQNMYLQSKAQWLCLETQEDYHPHVRTSVQFKHESKRRHDNTTFWTEMARLRTP